MRTPRTNQTWHSLADWLVVYGILFRRRPSSLRYRQLAEHVNALTEACIRNASAGALDDLERLVRRSRDLPRAQLLMWIDRARHQRRRPEEETAMARPTFAAAQRAILTHLQQHGWSTRPQLDVPRAIAPDGGVSLWFRPQSVYYAVGQKVSLNDAHSLMIDIRRETPDGFLKYVEGIIRRRKAAPAASAAEEQPAVPPSRLDVLPLTDPRVSMDERRYRVALLTMLGRRQHAEESHGKQAAAELERDYRDALATTPPDKLKAWRQQHRQLHLDAVQHFNEQEAQAAKARDFFAAFIRELSAYIKELPQPWQQDEQRRASVQNFIRERLYADHSMIPLGQRKRLVEQTFARLWRYSEFGEGTLADLVARRTRAAYSRAADRSVNEPTPAQLLTAVKVVEKMMVVRTQGSGDRGTYGKRQLQDIFAELRTASKARYDDLARDLIRRS